MITHICLLQTLTADQLASTVCNLQARIHEDDMGFVLWTSEVGETGTVPAMSAMMVPAAIAQWCVPFLPAAALQAKHPACGLMMRFTTLI